MASHLLQLLFFGGQILAVALLVYGAWLCLSAGRERPADQEAPAPEKPASAAAGDTPEGGAWA
jgi:threonine/homoserine/homoserine lactone efflux protein